MKKDETQELLPALYIVPTPIGNLDDITLRALKILAAADIIACEDTRNTGKLLNHYSIFSKKLESYYEFNELKKSQILIKEILNGKIVALTSDAGYPGISDPAYRIINEAISNNINVVPLPGAAAFLPALVGSGFPTDCFKFVGFPPQKKGRKTFIKKAAQEECTVIFYESPHRILKLIEELIEICGNDRRVCIAREISKIYEEFIRGNLKSVKNELVSNNKVKGEFVVILRGNG